MIRLFKVKEKQKEDAENSSGGVPVKKQSAGELRLQKGFSYVLLNSFISSLMLVFAGKEDILSGSTTTMSIFLRTLFLTSYQTLVDVNSLVGVLMTS